MSYWLFKEEPSHYSWEMLDRDGRTMWDGVRNNLALKHLRGVKKGDLAIFYHTGGESAVVGLMRVISNPYSDPGEEEARYVVVDVEPYRKLPRPVSLVEMKTNAKFRGWELLRIPRLSVMPVPPAIWAEILRLSGMKGGQ